MEKDLLDTGKCCEIRFFTCTTIGDILLGEFCYDEIVEFKEIYKNWFSSNPKYRKIDDYEIFTISYSKIFVNLDTEDYDGKLQMFLEFLEYLEDKYLDKDISSEEV